MYVHLVLFVRTVQKKMAAKKKAKKSAKKVKKVKKAKKSKRR